MTTSIFNLQARHALIADLSMRLAEVSPQFGKTVLMKLLYLLQEVYRLPLGYSFSFYTYGPYCPEVLVDLDHVKRQEGVRVRFLPDDPGGYKISPGPAADRVRFAAKQRLDTYADQLEKLVSSFGSFRARDLELRTTIVYLWKHMTPAARGNKVALMDIVRQLKPHFTTMEVETAVRELQDSEVIDKAGDWL